MEWSLEHCMNVLCMDECLPKLSLKDIKFNFKFTLSNLSDANKNR